MSQTLTENNTTPSANQQLVPPDERFWQRYSPHAELPLSGVSSLAVHLLVFGLMLLIGVVGTLLLGRTTRSLPVEAVRLDLGGGGGSQHGQGDGKNFGKQPVEVNEGNSQEAQPSNDPVDTDKPPEISIKPPTSPRVKFDESTIRYIHQSDTASAQALQKLAQANIRIQLPDRTPAPKSGYGKGGTGEGGGSGDGKGTGVGNSTGEGRGTLTQREKRMLRWSMLFDTSSGHDYLSQLQGLGAILAVPTDNTGKNYQIIRDLSARPAKLLNENINDIQRIYWIDDKPESVGDVLRILGVPNRGNHFVAFMPVELEQKLFDLEKKYAEKHHHITNEDRIVETRFRIRRTPKGYDPEVIGQKVK